MIIEWEYRERLKERICRVFLRGYREFLRDYREFLRDYREYFEDVKRDYKERVKNFQGYLDFEQRIKKVWLKRVFERLWRVLRVFWGIIERILRNYREIIRLYHIDSLKSKI